MVTLKFETPKERAFLRVKIARDAQARVERHRTLCGALELADLVEQAWMYVRGRDADFRAPEKEGIALPAKVDNSVPRSGFPPPKKPAGPRKCFVTPDALLR